MYRCESWTRRLITKEFMLLNGWCWAKLLRVPWTAKIKSVNSKRKSVLNIHWKD